jgi:hypothetical protein
MTRSSLRPVTRVIDVERGLALDALRRDLVSPGKNSGDNETQRQQQHQGLHDPGGRADCLEHDVGYLDNQPRDDRVGEAHANYVATTEFSEE